MIKYEASASDSEHIPITRWGKDHYSTLAYFETLATDNHGKIDNRKMRCDPRLHREFAHTPWTGKPYWTISRNGTVIEYHDDWNCAEDMVAEGLIELRYGTGKAVVTLTDLGWKIAAQLRKHRGNGGAYAEFEPELEFEL